MASQIYSIDEYNHYLAYSQRLLSIWQIGGRAAGYLFASIDWSQFVPSDYGHISRCLTATVCVTAAGMLLVATFTVYVHAYAQKKVARKKRAFYRFKKVAATLAAAKRKGRRTSNSLDALVPTLQSKLSFDLTRICNVNPRTKCSYFLIDGIQLHQESIRIFMDCHHRNRATNTLTNNNNTLDLQNVKVF